MRIVLGMLLLGMVATVVAFGLQNSELLAVRLFVWSAKAPISVVVGGTYVLGMLTGWTLLATVRHSVRQVTARRVED